MTYSRRRAVASPVFTGTNSSSISSGASIIIDFDKNDESSQKYLPFNFCSIANNSNQKISVAFDQDSERVYRVPGNTVKSYDKKSIPGFRSLLITNLGTASIDAEDIDVEAQHETPDTDSIVSGVLNKLVGSGL